MKPTVIGAPDAAFVEGADVGAALLPAVFFALLPQAATTIAKTMAPAVTCRKLNRRTRFTPRCSERSLPDRPLGSNTNWSPSQVQAGTSRIREVAGGDARGAWRSTSSAEGATAMVQFGVHLG